VGLIAALELFIQGDEEAEMRHWRDQSQRVVEALSRIPGVRATVEQNDYSHLIPQAVVSFDDSWKGPKGQEVVGMLQKGDPPIYLSPVTFGDELAVEPFSLNNDEVDLVARRLREVLTAPA